MGIKELYPRLRDCSKKYFTETYIAENHSTTQNEHKYVVVKAFDKCYRKQFSRGPSGKLMPKESMFYTFLKNKNNIIPEMIQILENEDWYFMVIEFLGRGWSDLFNVASYSIDESIIKRIILNVLISFEKMISVRCYYLDIKAENIMVNMSDCSVRIIDLEHMYYDPRGTDNNCTIYIGTRPYLSPEVLKNTPHRPSKSMSFSMGVLIHFLINNDYVFQSKEETFMKEIPMENSSPLAYDLITKCLDRNDISRINFSDIKYHPWFQQN